MPLCVVGEAKGRELKLPSGRVLNEGWNMIWGIGPVAFHVAVSLCQISSSFT